MRRMVTIHIGHGVVRAWQAVADTTAASHFLASFGAGTPPPDRARDEGLGRK